MGFQVEIGVPLLEHVLDKLQKPALACAAVVNLFFVLVSHTLSWMSLGNMAPTALELCKDLTAD